MALRSLLGFGKRSLSFLSNSSKFSTRRFSSDHKKPGIIFEGVEVHLPKRAHVIEGQAWGALLWFWVFYQTSENYDVILGLRKPFMHRGEVFDPKELPDGTLPNKTHQHH